MKRGTLQRIVPGAWLALLCACGSGGPSSTAQDEMVYSGGLSSLSFQVDNAPLLPGQNLFVVGDAPELGAWDPMNALPLLPANDVSWMGLNLASLNPGEQVSFKFILTDALGNVTWEDGDNRQLTVPMADSMSYQGTWGDTANGTITTANFGYRRKRDAGTRDAGRPPPTDAGTPPTDAGTGGTGGTGSVGPSGGSVDHLFFAVVGDTRPGAVNQTASYPTAVINKIYADIQGMSPRPQFVVTTGDYMFASPSGGQASAQIGYYTQALQQFSGTVFAAMGNHECDGYTAHNCTLGQTSNIQAFMDALVTPLGQSQPYYSIPINATDGSWTAKLIVLACNAWDSTQSSWLQSTLAQPTTYTFVARHEPAHATTGPCVTDVENQLASSSYNLSIVGHTHTFSASGKEVIVGTGGAPITSSTVPYGYATVEQTASGFTVTQYDYATAMPVSTQTIPF